MANVKTDYTRAELRDVSPKGELVALANRIGAEFHKSWKRGEIEKAILRRQRQLAKAKAPDPGPATEAPSDGPGELGYTLTTIHDGGRVTVEQR